MLRLFGHVSARFSPRHPFLASVLILLICTPEVWCVMPPVVFNGTASVMDTGSAALNHPKGVVADTAGNVYIADTAHSLIVKINRTGDASALAITGLTTALSAPEGLALDGSGNLYIADAGNNRIVEVTPAGAGSEVDLGGLTLLSPRGVAIDAAGNLYIANTGNNQILTLPSGGSAVALSITGLGTALNGPLGLSVDPAGNLYIADSANNRIVQVTSAGSGSVLSISGLGTALSTPKGVAVDGFGNIFIADSGNNRLVKVASGTGSVANTGSFMLASPSAVAVDNFGAVYIADTSNSRVVSLMISAVGFGGLQVGAAAGRSFTLPFTVSGATTLGSVQALMLGAQSLDFTLGAGTTCTNGTTGTSCDVEVQFLPLAPGLRRGGVALFDQGGTLLATVPVYGTGKAPFAALSPGTASNIGTGAVTLGSPFSAALDGAGNIYVGNYTGSNVVKIAAGGGSASTVTTGALTLYEAAGVAVDGAGNLYIADYGHNRIVLVAPTGAAAVLTVTGLGTAINQPAAIALDGAGNLYIADWGNSRIVKVSSSGAGSVLATGSYTLSATGVTGVAVDPSGNVYIADRVANRIVKVAASGAASLVTLTGLSLSNPQGVAVDGNGNLYIADSGHRRIVELTAAGVASVVPTPGLTLGSILYGVATDSSGNVFAVDWSNNRITKVTVASASLSFANTRIGATSSDSPKTATVTNLGNDALVFSGAPSYTSNFTENTADTNLCSSSASLDPGQVCDVSVLFTPQSAGSLTTNIAVTNNHLNGSNASQNVAVSGTGLSPITPTITWAEPSAIAYGTTLSAILNATATDGSSTVAGTFAYTATPQGGTASAVTATTVLSVGEYTLGLSFNPSNTTTYTSATDSVSLTVNKLAPSVTLEASVNPALVSSSVIFTATVSSSVGTPTGSVDFYDGETLLGSGTLASGVATHTSSTLAAGPHSVTALYAGDSNFSSITSSAVSEVVADLALTIASGGSATVSAGGTATYHLTVAPSSGSAFPAGVTLSASGGPTGSTITITPQTIAAGDPATNVTVAIRVPAASAAVYRSSAHRSNTWALGLLLPFIGALVLPFGTEWRVPARRRALFTVFLMMALVPAVAMLGCGDSHTTTPVQPKSYTVTVTATSGSVSHSTTLSLTVQ